MTIKPIKLSYKAKFIQGECRPVSSNQHTRVKCSKNLFHIIKTVINLNLIYFGLAARVASKSEYQLAEDTPYSIEVYSLPGIEWISQE